jgi:DNA-binding FadR family transcriptional regulator
MSGSLLKRLREEILSQPSGVSLGTETEIADRLNVGRATLRQAARILEQEQLITVQRGAKGGYVSRRPDVEGLARASTLYLSLKRATLKHLSVASRVLNVEVYRLAAMSDDDEGREKLKLTMDELRSSYREDMSVGEYLRRGEKIRNCILELADNPFLELFLTNAPDRIARMEARQWRMGEAILNREPEITAALNAEGWRLIESWLEPHEGAQPMTFAEEPKARSPQARRRRQAA